MSKHAHASPQGRATLAILQAAVTKALDRKQRLGQYAVVWSEGAPVMMGGDIDTMDLRTMLAERAFLQDQLRALPASEKLARLNAALRLSRLGTKIAEKGANAI